ncbi:YdeI/OmpD-associated family protein [Maribacter sp. PR1]|uniref:DUF1801 domain-containing protein n=1 Tax=Maribacter cobaltidurans TaxID=1178778 RepID=A0ABU7IY26_9FLAO|nr:MULTISPECIES: DUF1801 domain-containing protein [Maribacter]MDC6390338.1 YdeI/OmpD-associated family protein [Maribacter sp. PR1]MEE1977728.1 DUF1801 domain-containing protein [Maribacter cobaltidurans]
MEKFEKLKVFFSEEHKFKNPVGRLRDIVLKTGLHETFKWNFPTYTLNKKNVIAIGKFKNHFGIWFFKGSLLSDSDQVLENAQEGKTIAMRHWKFYKESEIDEKRVSKYITEAIEIQKKGIEFNTTKKKKPTKSDIPAILAKTFQTNLGVKQAFEGLTPYKQEEYIQYIIEAKQEKTKISRLSKIIPMILDGKGLHDKYR